MAKVIYPAEFPEMHGKFGGFVYSRNKYGPYVKEYRKSNRPRTENQKKASEAMKKMTEKWSTLTPDEVQSWNAVVKSYRIMSKARGKKGLLTGFMFFMKVNLNLMKIDCEPIRRCPWELKYPISLTSVEVNIITKPSKENIVIRFAPKLDKDNSMVVSATNKLAGGRRPQESNYRKIGVIDGLKLHGRTKCSILKMYKARFGRRIEENERVGFKLQVIEKETGQGSMGWYVMG